MKNELLAPNGKPSKLNATQYKLVRTTAFKKWFGDWENDPVNASKVIDEETKEPLVVYHGTSADFEDFSEDAERKGHSGNGFFFTSNVIQAESYTIVGFSNPERIKSGSAYEKNANIIPVFLRLINPLIVDAKNNHFREIGSDKYTYKKDFETNPKDLILQFIDWDNLWHIRDSKNGGTHFKFKTEKEAKIKILELKKAKKNIPITVEFTSYKGGKHLNEYISDLMDLENDGAIFKNIVDLGSAINEAYGVSEVGETIWVKNSNQIKSAIANNGEYDIENNNIRFEQGGEVLLAPNGKPSNLNAEQYKLVRTPAFKKWFGDWEKDPDNASKVIDENGEPLVVYHSSNSDFNTFKFNIGKGIYSSYSSFTENKRLSESYGNIIYEVFLKIQKPYIINGDGQYIWKVIDKKNSPDSFFDENVLPSFDGIIFKNVIDFNGKLGSKFILDVSNIYMVRKNTQIKLADGTNATFDDSNPDIRFEKGGKMKKERVSPEDYQNKMATDTAKKDIRKHYNFYGDPFDDRKDSENWTKYSLPYDTIFDIEFKNGGLIAPNGKPSNLNAEQYKLVRSSAFINWFGDWINDPDNASKVIDDNGEPLVVYHGSSFNFYEFDREKIGLNYVQSEQGGFFFTQRKQSAENYAKLHSELKGKGFVYECFLNTKNPLIRKTNSDYYAPADNYDINRGDYIRALFIDEMLDGIIIFGTRKDNLYVVNNSNQIKLADGTNTTFDLSNDDIRFEGGGEINEEAQQLIDIISMNPKLEKYQKYKVLLKDKFGIDFDLIYKDQEYIDNATLNDIKSKDDFFDFGNWLQYAKIISKKRGFVPMDSYWGRSEEMTDENWNETSKKLDFTVQKVEYKERGTGSGDIARAFGDTIVYTKEADLYYFLHEIGHIYDFQNVLTGIIKNPAYSPTNYGTTHSGETFAENFAIYFLNPTALKNWNEDVYYAMDSAINDKYKKELKKIVSEKSKYEKGGITNEQGFVIEELDDDLKEVYQNRAYKNVGEANFYFSRLNIYPELNVFTIELPNGIEVGRATLNEKGNYLTNIRLDYDYRRRGLASNLYEYIEYVIGKKLKPSPDKISIEAQKLWLKRNPDIQFKNGGRTISQTPAPKKDQVQGSDVNKKSSSKNLSSAKLIKFDDKTIESIKKKVKEHNAEYPDKKINLASAKAVVRRGMGAYSSSHRPTISGGKPNSRVAWGLARLNAFIYKIVNGKSKSGKYNQDDDLIDELGYKVANYKNGGEMKKDIRCINCGWEWNKKDSELWDMYICHKCGFDNTSFYTSDPINRLLKGGGLNSGIGLSPDYLKMFLGK